MFNEGAFSRLHPTPTSLTWTTRPSTCISVQNKTPQMTNSQNLFLLMTIKQMNNINAYLQTLLTSVTMFQFCLSMLRPCHRFLQRKLGFYCYCFFKSCWFTNNLQNNKNIIWTKYNRKSHFIHHITLQFKYHFKLQWYPVTGQKLNFRTK